jgi:hypothetical protein
MSMNGLTGSIRTLVCFRDSLEEDDIVDLGVWVGLVIGRVASGSLPTVGHTHMSIYSTVRKD